MKLLIVNIILLLNIVSFVVSAKSYRDQFRKVCGQRKKQFGRIVGGKNAALGEFPFFARIGLRMRHIPLPIFICGGSLITDRHVLTAEHCLYFIIKQQLADRLVVSLGDHNENGTQACVGDLCCDRPVIYGVSKMITYKLDQATFKDDISILVLEEKVEFTRWISPICLPDNISPMTLINESVQTIGLGLIDSRKRKLASTLQKITIEIKPFEECAMFPEPPGPGQICAGSSDKDSCDGDSGGPLFKSILDKGKRRDTQLGIVSYGAKDCENSIPAVYVDVNYYLKWIDSNLNNSSEY